MAVAQIAVPPTAGACRPERCCWCGCFTGDADGYSREEHTACMQSAAVPDTLHGQPPLHFVDPAVEDFVRSVDKNRPAGDCPVVTPANAPTAFTPAPPPRTFRRLSAYGPTAEADVLARCQREGWRIRVAQRGPDGRVEAVVECP